MNGQDGDVYGMVVLDNDKLASFSLDCAIKIWNSRNGQYKVTLKGHNSIVNDMIALSNGAFKCSLT